VTVVEGAVLLGKPRLIQVDGIYCEAPLSGHLIFMKNQDVPGVIGHVGMVLGRNHINIANFSLGRGEVPAAPGEPLEAVAVVSTDGVVPERVLQQLREKSVALPLGRRNSSNLEGRKGQYESGCPEGQHPIGQGSCLRRQVSADIHRRCEGRL
jgi:hypothetical protein